MDLVLTEQQSLLRDTAVKLAAAHGGPKRARKLRDAGTEIDVEAWRAVDDAGLLATPVAEAHGGAGLGAFDLALAIEEMGKQLLMVPLAEAAAARWALSQTDGNGAATAALGDALSGKRLIVPAMAAPAWAYAATGSGMRSSTHGATLDGSIEHVPFAAVADAFLIDVETAASSRSLCIASRDDVAITARRNVDGSTSSRVAASAARLDGVVATGDAAARIAARTQDLLVLWTAAELLGVAQAAHDMTTEYLKLRVQFGKPIGSFQALQHRMVDCFVDIELNRSLLYRVLAAWAEDAAFSIPEVRLGFAPGPLLRFFVRSMGLRAVRHYLLTGERFSGADALRMGLAHKLGETSALEGMLEATIDALLLGAPGAQACAKAVLLNDATPPVDLAGLRRLQAAFEAMTGSPEAVEGRASFAAKRKPDWYRPPG